MPAWPVRVRYLGMGKIKDCKAKEPQLPWIGFLIGLLIITREEVIPSLPVRE